MKKLFFLAASGLLLGLFSLSLMAGAAENQAAQKVKVKCAKKAAVVVETAKAGAFSEYRRHSLQAQAAVVPVKSPATGKLAVVMAGEGSRVVTGDDVMVIETVTGEELKKLEADAAARKKTWTARLNWKEKSPKAIAAAEKSYNEAVALMAAAKERSRVTVKAPASGTVRFMKDLGSAVEADAELLEIANPGAIICTLARRDVDSGVFTPGLKLDGQAGDLQCQAEVIAVTDDQVIFMFDNAAGLLKEDMVFAVRTLTVEHADVLAVPQAALFQDGLGDFVYTVEKKRAKKLYVRRGASEAGRTLLTTGLTAGMPLIVSGFDCLAAGKRVRVVNAEEMAKARKAAAAGAGEIAEKPAVAAKAGLCGGRLRLALHGTYYLMLGDNFRKAYVALNGFGGSLAYRFLPKIDLWLSGGLAAKNNRPGWSPVELKFKAIPLAADVRYYLMEKGKLSAFAGAGASVFLVTEEIPITDIETTLIGFNALAGGYYQFSRKFFGQLFLKFNMAQKDIYPDSELDNPMNLGSLEFNLGFGIRL
jgi:biotin carboxyl carrier protein